MQKKELPLLTVGLALWVILICGTQVAVSFFSRSERDDLALHSSSLDNLKSQVAESCSACHDLGSRRNGVGPHLVGIVGRQAGTVSNFQYSSALRSAGFVWSREKLREFLLNPSDTLPGTAMAINGIPEADVDALIDYLEGQL